MTETLNEYCKRTEQEKRELSQNMAILAESYKALQRKNDILFDRVLTVIKQRDDRDKDIVVLRKETSTLLLQRALIDGEIAEHIKERKGWEYERGNLNHRIQEHALLIKHHDYIISENRKTMEAWFNEIERLKKEKRELKENEKYQQDIYLRFRDRVKELEQENTAQKLIIDAQAAAIREWEQMGKITISFPGSSKKSCDTCKHQPHGIGRVGCPIACFGCAVNEGSHWEPIPTHKG